MDDAAVKCLMIVPVAVSPLVVTVTMYSSPDSMVPSLTVTNSVASLASLTEVVLSENPITTAWGEWTDVYSGTLIL